MLRGVMAARPSESGVRQSAQPHNRRAFPRMRAEFEVRLDDGSVRPGFEIGQAGLGFECPEPLPADSEMVVAYRLAPEEEWTPVKAQVRYFCDGRVGLEFLNIRRSERLRIMDFVNSNAQPD